MATFCWDVYVGTVCGKGQGWNTSVDEALLLHASALGFPISGPTLCCLYLLST